MIETRHACKECTNMESNTYSSNMNEFPEWITTNRCPHPSCYQEKWDALGGYKKVKFTDYDQKNTCGTCPDFEQKPQPTPKKRWWRK